MRRLLALALWLLLAGTAAAADTAPPPQPGMLLIAREGLPDPRFNGAVVLVVQHDDRGTVGLVINRPSRLPLEEAAPSLPALAGRQTPLSYGGPLSPRALMALVKVPAAPPDPSQRVFAATYLTGAEQLAAWPDRDRQEAAYRVFTGYSGWAPGQLDRELVRGDWHLLPAEEDLIYTGDWAAMWQELVRQGAEQLQGKP